jgi:predicted NBD/HSP70 family sugar kinase
LVKVVAGVDLGGTAINYTFLDQQGQFLIEGLCEHPARSVEGPDICLGQIADGLAIAAEQAGIRVENVVAIGLDTPGPASAAGVLSKRGSTNFVHAEWAGYDIRAGLRTKQRVFPRSSARGWAAAWSPRAMSSLAETASAANWGMC